MCGSGLFPVLGSPGTAIRRNDDVAYFLTLASGPHYGCLTDYFDSAAEIV